MPIDYYKNDDAGKAESAREDAASLPTDPKICHKCSGTGQMLVPGGRTMTDYYMPCDECFGTGRTPVAIAPFPDELVERAAAMAERVRAHDEKHQRRMEEAMLYGLRYSTDAKLVDAAVKGMFSKAAEASEQAQGDAIDLEACQKDVNPNGVHVIVRDKLVALETEDLSITFEEQMKYDLPQQVAILTRFAAEVMAQLMMNELSPDGSVNKDTIHYWLDVFDFMGPDYFQSLKKLVAKLEWTI